MPPRSRRCVGLARSLARDFGGDNIRVNVIAPGWIMTERQLTLWLTPEADAMRAERQALKRRLVPEDVARVALFLDLRGIGRDHRRSTTSSTAAGSEAQGAKRAGPDEIRDIARPAARAVGGAGADRHRDDQRASSTGMGVRDPHIRGPVPLVPGRTAAGPALTLQCMPKREDLFDGAEYDNPELQLHRHVMFPAQAGRHGGGRRARRHGLSGIFGEMMLTYLAGRGGAGVVVDGCIRDSRPARGLDLGIWVRGATPNYHAQTALIPFAVNVPVACGGVLVMPGDIVVADDDGAVVVPVALAPSGRSRSAGEHAEWEEFSRLPPVAGRRPRANTTR